MNTDPVIWNENHDDNFIDYFIKNLPDQNIKLESTTVKFIGDKTCSLSKDSFSQCKKKKKTKLLKASSWYYLHQYSLYIAGFVNFPVK